MVVEPQAASGDTNALGKRKREDSEDEGPESSTSKGADCKIEDETKNEDEHEESGVDVRMKEPEEDESETSTEDETSSATSPSSSKSCSESSSSSESEDETDSESESDTTESTASSDSDSSTSSSSTSSSDDSTTVEESTAHSRNLAIPKPVVPPGQGTVRTHLRNHRKTRVKKLKRLIAKGTLPKGSTLDDLNVYEQDATNTYFSSPYEREVLEPSDEPERLVEEEEIGEVGEEEPPTGVKVEEEEPTRVPPQRIDVAAVSRFIKAGLVGNEGYDRARQEARVRGKDKKITPSDFEIVRERPLLPRKVGAKKQKTSISDIRNFEMKESEKQKLHNKDPEATDPFLAGFYEQIELAAQARQCRYRITATTTNKSTKGPIEGKGILSKLVVKAFECEPEWCGMVEVEEGQEVDSVEIDPPSLPFIDNYPRTKKSALKTQSTPPSDAAKSELPLSEAEILQLPKLNSPFVGAQIFFKSLFLHPRRFEPTILRRWGKITSLEGESIRIAILGPIFKPEEDVEIDEGEIEGVEELLSWRELRDVRLLIPEE